MFEGFLGSIYLSLISFSVVFLILVLLSLVMFSFKIIFAKEESKKKREEVKEALVTAPGENFIPEKQEDEQEVAAIMSAIYSYLGTEKKFYRINFIREISPQSVFWKKTAKTFARRK